VFALERRIYRIDTLRLNPSGIPLRGIGYALVLVVLALIASSVPPSSWLDPLIPWYLREIGAPLASAALLGALRVEGRPFHTAVAAIISHALGPARLARLAPVPRRTVEFWRPPEVLLVPDGSDAVFRRLRYRGPGAVLVNPAHRLSEPGGRSRVDVVLRPAHGTAGRPGAFEMAPGAVLEVLPS